MRLNGTMRQLVVQVTDEALSRAAKDAPTAIIELVRNAIDADATDVEVVVETRLDSRTTLEGEARDVPTKVIVRDNGHGISPAIAEGPFAQWGDSWKANRLHSPSQRRLLGKNGEGRFAVYGLGRRVEWDSVYRGEKRDLDDERSSRVVIVGDASQRHHFGWDESPVPRGREAGTVVTIDDLLDDKRWLLSESAQDRLVPGLALALRAYPVTVKFRGAQIDPSLLTDHESEYPISAGDSSAILHVVEWKRRLDRNQLHWCDLAGMSYYAEDPEVPAPGFFYTAYVQWEDAQSVAPRIVLGEGFNPEIKPLLDAAKLALNDHFFMRAQRRRTDLVEELRREGSYPFSAVSSSEAEEVERELFDVITVAAAPTVKSIKNRKARKMTLALLREALASDPGRLRQVLEHVIDLPPAELEQLHELLQHTTLSSMVRLSRTVYERLLVIQGLRAMLFDDGLYRRVRERQHLHEVLAAHTWIFGDEYALFASDQTLRTVVKKHLGKHLGRLDLVDAVAEGLGEGVEDLRLDLGLAAQLPQTSTEVKVLVVEIKRPTVRIRGQHVEQIVEYAQALTEDREMSAPGVVWDFLVVGTQLDKSVTSRLTDGIYTTLDQKHRVKVVTWAEVLQACEFRLQWLRAMLGTDPSRETGLEHLRDVHASFLPPSASVADSLPRRAAADAPEESLDPTTATSAASSMEPA